LNILLINHYAGSDRLGMEYRPFYLAREWVASGHSATLVAAAYSHLRNRQPVVPADLESTDEEGVRFRWLRTNRYVGSGAARVANMLTFVTKLFAHADRIARDERPDVVICSSTYPLDIYPGARIARKMQARLVFEVHDLWPLTPILLGGYSRRHPYIRLLQCAEDWAYGRAEMVVSLLPDSLDYMVGRGLDPRKFVHIPNGIPVSRLLSTTPGGLPPPVEVRIEQERRRARFLVGYAGGINVAMALETLVETAHLLARSDITFLVAGDGPQARALQAQITRSKIDNFHLLGHIPKPSMQNFLSQMDALAIPFHRSPLYRFGVSPNKVFDYMFAGKPIVQASEASNDLVAEADCGFTVPPENPDAIADALLRLIQLSPAERRRLGKNGRRFVLRNHDYRVLAQRFIDALS
jgi:glycosyltransferase involved in cell wall biosynthesis